MQKQKGFTIIELVVVIAIIAVLAAIVLVNVTQYINKGKDAAIKGNMSSIMTNAVIYFDDVNGGNGDYTGFAAAAGYEAPAAAITSANAAPTMQINAGGTAYCVTAALKDGNTYCIDSTGYKGTTANCDATTADCAAD